MGIKLYDDLESGMLRWKRNRTLSGVAVGICTFLGVSFLFSRHLGAHRQLQSTLVFPGQSEPWSYKPSRDAGNYGLSDEQCAVAFPNLYKPIEASMERFKGGINLSDTMGDIHWGECRAMIYNNQIYVLDDWPNELADNRKFATLHAINRALLAVASTGHRFPNIEFSLAFQDRNPDPSRPSWAYDRLLTDNVTVLVPDFGLYSWPAHNVGTYPEVRLKIQTVEESLKFEDKIPKLVWRGTVDFGTETRHALVNATAGKPWSEVKPVYWASPDFKDNMITMQEHCKYQFLAQTEGLAYSGRLKYLHNCESVIVAHEFEYETHDQHLMVDSGPEQNYVLVKRDFSDLSEKMDWLLAHPEDAARIARNNAAVFRDRYLTPAAEACYWRKLIHEWAKHSNFEPAFFKGETSEWRGVPYESFALERQMHWNEQNVG